MILKRILKGLHLEISMCSLMMPNSFVAAPVHLLDEGVSLKKQFDRCAVVGEWIADKKVQKSIKAFSNEIAPKHSLI
jgi:hypothetical protein